MIHKFAIHGVPRSGTTWVGELFNSSPNVCYCYQPLFSYALKGYLDNSTNSVRVDKFYEELAVTGDSYIAQSEGQNLWQITCF